MLPVHQTNIGCGPESALTAQRSSEDEAAHNDINIIFILPARLLNSGSNLHN